MTKNYLLITLFCITKTAFFGHGGNQNMPSPTKSSCSDYSLNSSCSGFSTSSSVGYKYPQPQRPINRVPNFIKGGPLGDIINNNDQSRFKAFDKLKKIFFESRGIIDRRENDHSFFWQLACEFCTTGQEINNVYIHDFLSQKLPIIARNESETVYDSMAEELDLTFSPYPTYGRPYGQSNDNQDSLIRERKEKNALMFPTEQLMINVAKAFSKLVKQSYGRSIYFKEISDFTDKYEFINNLIEKLSELIDSEILYSTTPEQLTDAISNNNLFPYFIIDKDGRIHKIFFWPTIKLFQTLYSDETAEYKAFIIDKYDQSHPIKIILPPIPPPPLPIY